MNQELRDLINAYQAAVSRSVRALRESGVELPRSNLMWALAGPKSGTLESGGQFRKHGYGCTVHIDGIDTDFDFGPGGETDGFDGWRLYRFTGDHGITSPYTNYRELDVALETAAAKGEIVRLGDSSLYHWGAS
jgi:hypothetical protein